MKLRVLVVDDEPLARARVRTFLRGSHAVEVIGECANGFEALGAIRTARPDIMFLDVQMPGCNGLQLLATLQAERRPATVLVTAHDRFAVEAFAAQAIDYLVKPFGRERFQLALKRATDHVRASRAADLKTRLEGMISAAPPERIIARADGRVIFLKPSDIIWVEAANNYSSLHLAGAKRLLLRETISSLEKRLGSSNFARVNRSALVAIDQVQELTPASYGDYSVLLQNGVRLPLSRSLRGRFDRFVSGR